MALAFWDREKRARGKGRGAALARHCCGARLSKASNRLGSANWTAACQPRHVAALPSGLCPRAVFDQSRSILAILILNWICMDLWERKGKERKHIGVYPTRGSKKEVYSL